MTSSRVVCLFFPIFTYLFLSAFTTVRSDELFYQCAANASFVKNSTYHANLNRLLSNLSSDIQKGAGFYNVSYGQNNNKVNAIALCRGDIGAEICRSCITNSTKELKKECPTQKAAIVWHDECMLRYSNRSIFGKMRTEPQICMANPDNASNTNQFYQVVTTLLDDLKSRAASGGTRRKFAIGKGNVSHSETVYALVQCTPDLSKAECSNCLSNVTALIPQCSQGRKGGRILTPSCNFRYEQYLFYNTTAGVKPISISLPPASPPSMAPASPPSLSPASPPSPPSLPPASTPSLSPSSPPSPPSPPSSPSLAPESTPSPPPLSPSSPALASPPPPAAPPRASTATRKGMMRSKLQILIALVGSLFSFQYLGF
ncbi:hypothetical protein SLA2020_043670 [Shorea laevis]